MTTATATTSAAQLEGLRAKLTELAGRADEPALRAALAVLRELGDQSSEAVVTPEGDLSEVPEYMRPLSDEEFHAKLQAGLDDVEAGRTGTLREVFDYAMARRAKS